MSDGDFKAYVLGLLVGILISLMGIIIVLGHIASLIK